MLLGERGATRGDRRQDATHPLVHRLDVEFLDLSRCSERRVVSGTTGVSIGFKESGTGMTVGFASVLVYYALR